MTRTERWNIDRQPLAWGVVLLVLGIALALVQFDVLEVDNVWRWWPLLMIVGGIGTAVGAADQKARGLGVWLCMVGAWQLVNTLRLFGFTWSDSWPLILIGVGLLGTLWPECGKERGGGVGLMVIGFWLLINTRGYFGLSWSESWPLLMVFGGFMMVLEAVRRVIPAVARRQR
jgi:hypothetical protein